jgi:hypothetical protein
MLALHEKVYLWSAHLISQVAILFLGFVIITVCWEVRHIAPAAFQDHHPSLLIRNACM